MTNTGSARRLAILGLAVIASPGRCAAPRSGSSRGAWAAEARRKLAVVINGNGRFGFELYRRLAPASAGNFCFSPYNLGVAFSMAWAGAAGETAEEMAEVLHFGGSEDHPYALTNQLQRSLQRLAARVGFELDTANAVWVPKDFPIRQEYLDVLARGFATTCGIIDVVHSPARARALVNRWTARKTRIPALLDPGFFRRFSAAARPALFLTSAVVFRSGWQTPFPANATRTAVFTRLDGKTRACRLLHGSGKYAYAEVPGIQVIDIPFRGRIFSLSILLPRTHADFTALERHLSFRRVAGLLRALEYQAMAAVEIPEFAVGRPLDLGPIMEKLGMHRAFDPERADFRGLSSRRPLWLAGARQLVQFSVKAPPGAGVAVPRRSPPPSRGLPRFRADHPFLFLIRERSTGALLLLGRVLDPGAPGPRRR